MDWDLGLPHVEAEVSFTFHDEALGEALKQAIVNTLRAEGALDRVLRKQEAFNFL